MSYASQRNNEKQGGSTWVVSGNIDVVSSGIVDVESGGTIEVAATSGIKVASGGQIVVKDGGNITVSDGGQIAMPVTSCTSTDGPIPNYGMCIIHTSEADADCREVAQPTRAGLRLDIANICTSTVGVNVCVASMTSLADCTISSSGVTKTIAILTGSTQVPSFSMVSADTSSWYVIGEFGGTISSAGST